MQELQTVLTWLLGKEMPEVCSQGFDAVVLCKTSLCVCMCVCVHMCGCVHTCILTLAWVHTGMCDDVCTDLHA